MHTYHQIGKVKIERDGQRDRRNPDKQSDPILVQDMRQFMSCDEERKLTAFAQRDHHALCEMDLRSEHVHHGCPDRKIASQFVEPPFRQGLVELRIRGKQGCKRFVFLGAERNTGPNAPLSVDVPRERHEEKRQAERLDLC